MVKIEQSCNWCSNRNRVQSGARQAVQSESGSRCVGCGRDRGQ
jgi:hypothetical protein